MRVTNALPGRSADAVVPSRSPVRPALTVVVPVYNGGNELVANVEHIRRSVLDGLRGDGVEVIVVSDGSIDGSAERLLESRDSGVRIIHYDRNLGKGYAVKAGALASHGEWVAFVDADLDLEPSSIPDYLQHARDEGLDFAIGSKRHPDSVVEYPRSRQIASWCYQALNRALFRLDVADTQVGLKVLSRGVVDEVVPLLLVKQFAFDLELLAVATALGRGRIRELPVRLAYRFTGSALGSVAVLRALWDTAAVFYRLRILHTYQRKQRLIRGGLTTTESLPAVELLANPEAARVLDYPRMSSDGELVARLGARARPAGNWISAAIPYFADNAVAAVVAPTVAPLRGSVGERTAAAVLESRLGGGSRRSRHFPGNLRVVNDYPAENVIIRRTDFEAARAADVGDERLVAWLAKQGRTTIYTPETSVSQAPVPVFRPHLRGTLSYASARGAVARATRGRSLSTATTLSLVPAASAIAGAVLIILGSGASRAVGVGLVSAYAAVAVVSALLAAARFRSPAVGLLAIPAMLITQTTYVAGFLYGLIRTR